MGEIIKVYKGTDKDMKCRGMQYELGKTVKDDGAVRCGNKGFHSCEAPFDVLKYYPVCNGNRFFEAEAGGVVDRSGADDSKLASSELTLKAEIGLPGMVKAQIEYVKKNCTNEQSNVNVVCCLSTEIEGGKQSKHGTGEQKNERF